MQAPLPVIPIELPYESRGVVRRRSGLVRAGGWLGFFALVSTVLCRDLELGDWHAHWRSAAVTIGVIAGRFVLGNVGLTLIIGGTIRNRLAYSPRIVVATLVNLVALTSVVMDGYEWHETATPKVITRWKSTNSNI